MTPEPADSPVAFRRAVAELRDATVDPAVAVREIPAPLRLAPHSYAVGAEIVHGEDELAQGRFIVLHDPDGQDAWDGATRIVVFASARVEDEMADDPLVPEVAWRSLLDGLVEHGAHVRAEAGTVTRTTSHRFGAMSGDPAGCELELRCSWTPRDGDDLGRHLAAFADVLCWMAGLPPSYPGVARLPLARRSG